MQTVALYLSAEENGYFLRRHSASDRAFIHFQPDEGEELPFPEIGQLVPYDKIPELQTENSELYDILADAAQDEYNTLIESLEG